MAALLTAHTQLAENEGGYVKRKSFHSLNLQVIFTFHSYSLHIKKSPVTFFKKSTEPYRVDISRRVTA